MIELHRVSKSFEVGDRRIHVLRELDLTIAAGSFTSIMGPSGSGKSTLLNIVGFMEAPTQGRVTVLGKDASGISETERARLRAKTVGFVFQNFNLLPRMTVLENVMLPGRYSGMSRAEAKARAEQLLASLGLGERLEHRPSQLSGGERQRTSLARALLNQPSLLVADEPTGNLDPQSTGEVGELFNRLNASGIAILIVTHNPAMAALARTRLKIENGYLSTSQ
jgi:putative ABC transport system ATP-binding protein